MSVSDPLIKDIKGHALALFRESQSLEKIPDSSINLLKFCETLESIFHTGFIASKKVDVFSWMASVAEERTDLASFNYRTSVEHVKTFKNVHTPLGKFRLLLRHCLMKKCINLPIETITSNKNQSFYQANAIISDEILSAILLSVVLQCQKIPFDLDLENASFLDFTWQMPEVLRLELVPCRHLGIAVSFSENKAVIVNVESNGVVAETGQVRVGDVLDKLNGVAIDSSSKGRLNIILRQRKGPIDVTIVKAFHGTPNGIFPPIKRLLQNLTIDVSLIESQYKSSNIPGKKEEEIVNGKSGTRASYLGVVNMGLKGSVRQIEVAMRQLLGIENRAMEKIAVVFEIGEINVKVLNAETSEVVLMHSYMQISACGSSPSWPQHIAYIAGNDTCDRATEFNCYIFHVNDLEEARTLLQSIGQGFYRTHFAV